MKYLRSTTGGISLSPQSKGNQFRNLKFKILEYKLNFLFSDEKRHVFLIYFLKFKLFELFSVSFDEIKVKRERLRKINTISFER